MSSLRASRAIWWGLPALIVLLWVAGVLVVPAIPGLPQSPESVWVALPVTRFIRDVAAAIAVGSVVVGGLLLPKPSRRALQWASVWALVWLAALAVQAVMTLSDLLAVDPWSILTPSTLWSFLTQVQVGQVLLAQAAGAATLAAAAWLISSRPAAWVLAVVGTLAVAAPGLSGHGGLTGGHESATISLALHIAAVSLWVGGLITVIALLAAEPSRAAQVLPRFSTLALVCVIVVAETGLLNASLRLASPANFLATPYGALIIGKALLLAFLVTLGWRHRRSVVPEVRAGEPITGTALAKLAGLEFLAMGIAIAASVTLSRVGPAPDPRSPHLVDPLTLVLLALALPLFIRSIRRSTRVPAWLARYPEVAGIALLVVAVVVCGVGALESLLGTNLGALVSAALLVVFGWLFVSSADAERGRPVVIGAMVGWPIAVVAITYLEAARMALPPLAPIVVSTLLAEALLFMWWRSMAPKPAPVLVSA